MRLRLEGLLPGVPDLDSPEPVATYHGLRVELKHPHNYPSDAQQNMLLALRARGYAAYWCDSYEDTLALFAAYYGETL